MNLKPRKLTTTEFCIGLGLKILLGIAYGYLFLHFYNGDDTWQIHQQATKETALLLRDPAQFFINEYTPVHALSEGNTVKEIFLLYINDLEYAFVVKTVALLNVISQGNYYINAVLFNLIVFWGPYWLFVFFTEQFPDMRKRLYAAIFLFLPAVFWLSGIRADGLLFFFFSLFLLNVYRRKNILAVIAFAGVFIMRPQFAGLLLLALIPYFISLKWKGRAVTIFAISYLVAIILFFAFGLENLLIEKQQQFYRLKGTRFEMQRLQRGIESFIETLPAAVNHTFLRPYPWEAKNVLQLFYSFEMLFFWVLIIIVLFRIRDNWTQRLYQPVILMLLFFCLSVYIITGYIVPFPGAIVRYKIIPELILICLATLLMQEKINIKISSKNQGFKQ